MIQLYPAQSSAMIQLQVLSQRSDGFETLKIRKSIFEAEPPLQGSVVLDDTAKNRPTAVGERFYFWPTPNRGTWSRSLLATRSIAFATNGQSCRNSVRKEAAFLWFKLFYQSPLILN